MELRALELVIHSAKDVPNVRYLGKMKVYAKVSISGDPNSELVTPVDNKGETNPLWNYQINYILADQAVQLREGTANVVIRLYCKRLLGDRYIGEANINLKSLFDYSQSYQGLWRDVLRFDDNGTFGKLCLSYRFTGRKPCRFGKILKGGALILLEVGLQVAQVLFQG